MWYTHYDCLYDLGLLFTHLKSWVPKGSRNIHLSITRMSIKWNTSSSLLVFLYQPICESTYQSIYQSMFLSTVDDYVIIYLCGCRSSYLYAIQRKLSQSETSWICFEHVSSFNMFQPTISCVPEKKSKSFSKTKQIAMEANSLMTTFFMTSSGTSAFTEAQTSGKEPQPVPGAEAQRRYPAMDPQRT